jgi:tripartite motif-containing protein 9/67
MLISNEFMSLSSTSPEYRTVLGSIAFSRGVHYWEITVDRHDANADVVVGVAQPAIDRRTMLGRRN